MSTFAFPLLWRVYYQKSRLNDNLIMHLSKSFSFIHRFIFYSDIFYIINVKIFNLTFSRSCFIQARFLVHVVKLKWVRWYIKRLTCLQCQFSDILRSINLAFELKRSNKSKATIKAAIRHTWPKYKPNYPLQ